jgi:hypothetical protein
MSNEKYIIITPSLSGIILHNRECIGIKGCSDVVTARHLSLAMALNKYKNKPLLWLDDDVSIKDSDIKELFRVQKETNESIIVGWYPNSFGEPIFKPKNNWSSLDWHELYSCGMGCVLIMPNVWNYIGEPNIPILNSERGKYPAVFKHVISWDSTLLGEDFSFCVNMRKEGFKIIAANNVCLTHKGKTLDSELLKKDLKDLFSQKNTITTLVNCCGPNRRSRDIANKSIKKSDLSDVKIITESSGNILTDWITVLRRASQETSDLVLMMEDDVVVCSDIESRIKNWEFEIGNPWYSRFFGAASLCRIGACTTTVPSCGGQAVLTTPNMAKQLLDIILPLVEPFFKIKNSELSDKIFNGEIRLVDEIFWDEIKKLGLIGLYSPQSWAKHIGVNQSCWNKNKEQNWETPDFVEN